MSYRRQDPPIALFLITGIFILIFTVIIISSNVIQKREADNPVYPDAEIHVDLKIKGAENYTMSKKDGHFQLINKTTNECELIIIRDRNKIKDFLNK